MQKVKDWVGPQLARQLAQSILRNEQPVRRREKVQPLALPQTYRHATKETKFERTYAPEPHSPDSNYVEPLALPNSDFPRQYAKDDAEEK